MEALLLFGTLETHPPFLSRNIRAYPTTSSLRLRRHASHHRAPLCTPSAVALAQELAEHRKRRGKERGRGLGRAAAANGCGYQFGPRLHSRPVFARFTCRVDGIDFILAGARARVHVAVPARFVIRVVGRRL